MINLNYQIDPIQYQILKIILSILLKKHGEDIDNSSVQIYVNKIENRATFKIKNGYILEPLTSETQILLGSTENKTTKGKNGENVAHLEVTEVVLVHYDIVNNDYQKCKIQECYIHLFQINLLAAY